MKLPTQFRPTNSAYRECKPGKDLPSWFMDDLKSIDEKLYIVYHPFAMIWDDMMNQYAGKLEDPRFTIHREHGEECWGFVTTDSGGAPIPEGAWHVWRLCEPHGWAHVVRIDSKNGQYLRNMVERLYIQAQFRDRYGDIAWNRHMDMEQQLAQQAKQKASDEGFEAVQEENAWLTRNARDNMARGITAPTNPTVEKVISYPGQKNKTATSRPLDDSDVGLKGIEDL
jgi:hypothetical protein